MNETSVAQVVLWGSTIGYVAWDETRQVGVFEYTPEFRHSGVEVAPLKMPLGGKQIYLFTDLRGKTFHGLPGLLADSLPDKFGNALIAEWLARQGRALEAMNPFERLSYVGDRGMGALEFRPSSRPRGTAKPVKIDELVALAAEVLANRRAVRATLAPGNEAATRDGLNDLLMIGTSAGGARAKCVIAYNEVSGDVRSGQVAAPAGYSHWLLKLDGVKDNGDKEMHDPQGYGAIEFAYHLMAHACGIEMTPCRLLHENGRAHFMTRRFDRGPSGEKLHMQSLCALQHFDFNLARAHSYEQALDATRRISASPNHDLEQQVRRAIFNVIGRNQDDHTKNIAFLMNKKGEWRLSPAFDVAYSFNENGAWTSRHQMLVNGKSDGFTLTDLEELGKAADLRAAKVREIVAQTADVFAQWETFAERAGVHLNHRKSIKANLRLHGWSRTKP